MTSIAEDLGAWISTLKITDIPDSLQQKARDHLLDTVGAAIIGDGRRPVTAAAAVFDAPGRVPLLIRGTPRHPVDAAKVNAVAAHAAEIDDTEGCDHTGAVVVPPLLSVIADQSLTGDDVLVAMIAGYEVGRRMQNALGGYDAHNRAGWHSTATCGVFAAAAAASRALGLSPSECTAALAIAASSSAGTWAFAEDGSMTKQLHVSNAAGAGLQAALLARAGATGPRAIFDNVWGGYFTTHGNPESVPHKLTAGMGDQWHFAHSAIKMYAACRSAHPAIDGVIDELRLGEPTTESITSVRIELSPFLRRMICPPAPSSIEAARMSLPISIALLLLGEELDPDTYARFTDAETVRILDTIRVVESEALATPQSVRVILETPTGAQVIERDSARGSEHTPFTTDEVEAKFRRLTEPRIGRAASEGLIRFVADLGPAHAALPTLWAQRPARG